MWKLPERNSAPKGTLVTDYRAQFREWDTAKSFLMRGERGELGTWKSKRI